MISFNTISFVSWPNTPEIEFIRINNDAVVTIIFGFAAFKRKRIGLKKIPPPIPTIPEIRPKIEPIINEKKKTNFFYYYVFIFIRLIIN